MEATRLFIAARDLLLAARSDYESARRNFNWPQFGQFNWALDFFDHVARGPERTALRLVDDYGLDVALSYADLALRSNQVANFLAQQGVSRGDRVLLMIGNVPELWETMLALMKLGAIIIPTTTLLAPVDLADRLSRADVSAIIAQTECTGRFDALTGAPIRIAVGNTPSGWVPFARSRAASSIFTPTAPTEPDDLLLFYFTSGTTAKPKLVGHTHQSYPVGHLSTMYWLGLRPGDVHLNLSSPGWAKHAWSCVFAPWNAEATVIAYQYERFSAAAVLSLLERYGVTSFCAPPTVWRMLIQEDLVGRKVELRELISAGEPLNPEVIDKVRAAWGLTIRDGYGQTETTAMIGNSPDQRVVRGSMGRPLPGYEVTLLGADGNSAEEGEICIDLRHRPVGLMQGYLSDARAKQEAQGRHYRTGDVARRDPAGYITYIGRADDVFKCSDYRISPFELESVLIEHPAVAEAAVVPSPHPTRLAVPKAYIVLAGGHAADATTAQSIFAYVRERVSPYKRIRRIQFADLPKTISGKIRRVELRHVELARREPLRPEPGEYWEPGAAADGDAK